MKCILSYCDQPTASETFPDLVSPDGTPVDIRRCVVHQLDHYREQIAELTFYESQLTMADLTRRAENP